MITALALGALELAVVVIFHWSLIASLWELQYGSLWLAPGALLLSCLALAPCAALARALLENTPPKRWLTIGSFAIFGALVAYGVSDGRHFDLWWRRVGFVAVVAGGAGFAAFHLGPLIARQARERRRVLALGCACAAVCFEVLNAFVLVRLYPAFHWGLALLTVFSVALFAALIDASTTNVEPADHAAPPRRALTSLAWLVLPLAAALLWQPASQRLARFDNFRLLLLDEAPLLGNVVQASALLAPPPALPEFDEAAGQGAARGSPANSSAARVSFTDRDILLISVDALRADHLGSYGYSRPTTPNIDALAAEGVRFERAYCATPHTSYSVTSLMTGKYIRPLLLQGIGEQSETWASLLKTYGYRTAAFYPPAIFFIDSDRFESFSNNAFGFEYQKKEFLEGPPRVAQLEAYLAERDTDQRLFVWVHLFGPHEPYDLHPEFDFGPRDIDRYDSEVRAADETVGQLVAAFRKDRPNAVVMLTSDHGEEFGDHGGRYHGTSVYEEQVRVPLVISARGAVAPHVVEPPVQTIDLLPTTLAALGVPLRPRLRGRDLGPQLAGAGSADDDGFAYAETDQHSLLAEGSLRLLCQRKLGACRLYDLQSDPTQQRDIALDRPDDFSRLRQRLRRLNSTHGKYERRGLQAEGKGWPAPILRAISGDGDAAAEVSELLDDADLHVRRKAAETLFRLHRPETAPSLRLALQRDEDFTVRAYAALALTRMGQGASLTGELLDHSDVTWRRLAALALAETGDDEGRFELIAWWSSGQRDYTESMEMLAAFANIQAEDAVPALLRSLPEVRLRAEIAKTLGSIGDPAARGLMARALANEPYQTARSALATALLRLGADNELVVPLRRWLGVADPLQEGLRIATEAGILEHVGGPGSRDLERLRENAAIGEMVRVVVPKTGDGRGLRLLVRARNTSSEPGQVWVGLPHGVFAYDSKGKLTKARKVPEIHPTMRIAVPFAAGGDAVEAHTRVPPEFGLAPGRASFLVVLATRGIELESLAVLPTQAELSSSAEPQQTVQVADEEAKAEDSTRRAGKAGEQ